MVLLLLLLAWAFQYSNVTHISQGDIGIEERNTRNGRYLNTTVGVTYNTGNR